MKAPGLFMSYAAAIGTGLGTMYLSQVLGMNSNDALTVGVVVGTTVGAIGTAARYAEFLWRDIKKERDYR